MASLDLSERPRLLAAGAQHGAQQLTPRAGCRVDLPPRAGPSATTRSPTRSWSLCAVRRLGPADLVDLSAAAGRRGRVDGGRRADPHADAGGQRRRPRCFETVGVWGLLVCERIVRFCSSGTDTASGRSNWRAAHGLRSGVQRFQLFQYASVETL